MDGLLVAPGFIDVQLNGAHGIDLTSSPAQVWDVAGLLPRYGVSAFLPTLVTAPLDVSARAQRALAAGPPPGWRGATPLGLHLEGPMLNPGRRGAHSPQHLRLPSKTAIDGWSRADGVAVVTLAPELPGVLEVVRLLRGRGVVVSAGHTDATVDDMRAAVDAGVTYVTHLFNAMAPFLHLAPGVIGTAFSDDRLTVGLIADGVHVDPVAVAAAWRAIGPARLNLVTDAVAALGLSAGVTMVGDMEIHVGPDGVRLADGTLAGSNLSLDQAVRNLVAFTGCPPHEAIATVTATPARLLGVATKGAVAPGCDADLTVLTADLDLVATLVAGDLLHVSEHHGGQRIAQEMARWRS